MAGIISSLIHASSLSAIAEAGDRTGIRTFHGHSPAARLLIHGLGILNRTGDRSQAHRGLLTWRTYSVMVLQCPGTVGATFVGKAMSHGLDVGVEYGVMTRPNKSTRTACIRT